MIIFGLEATQLTYLHSTVEYWHKVVHLCGNLLRADVR